MIAQLLLDILSGEENSAPNGDFFYVQVNFICIYFGKKMPSNFGKNQCIVSESYLWNLVSSEQNISIQNNFTKKSADKVETFTQWL